jgi:hypothetical protein
MIAFAFSSLGKGMMMDQAIGAPLSLPSPHARRRFDCTRRGPSLGSHGKLYCGGVGGVGEAGRGREMLEFFFFVCFFVEGMDSM